jgi:UDP-N-acetylglucosamine--N-acetylmuramyl-(pentapeptide) pyrophosphoryl-undecaprenol N-acetylglucosamine transferase
VVTGGGTGGHTYPALTTVQALARQGVPLQVTWIGSAVGVESKVAAEHGIAFETVATGKVRRSPSLRDLLRNGRDAIRVPIGFAQAREILSCIVPDVVLSTGGYVAVPVGLAARTLSMPLVVHEQTATLGLANRVLARCATRIAVSHATTLDALSPSLRARAVVTGNPIRPELLTGDRAACFRHFGLDPSLPLIYVTGGAMGALRINTLIREIVPELTRHAQILHQHGPGLEPGAPAARYHPVPFVGSELRDVLAAADLVVSRSGAGTVAELFATGTPAVYIPMEPSAADEQRRNAEYAAASGAALCLPAPTPARLLAALRDLVTDSTRREAMSRSAAAVARPDAAETLATLLVQAGRRAALTAR